MDKFLKYISSFAPSLLTRDAVISLMLLFLLLVVRFFVVRTLLAVPFSSTEQRRKWLVTIRNIFLLVTIIGMMTIWAQELRTLALSLVAFAAAVVLAIKELFSCISGSFLRTTGQAFSIGDRIEVNNLRGDVIDHTLLTTTIMEVGPHENSQKLTGRTIVIPNSVFLNVPVSNETFLGDFIFHTMTIPWSLDDDWQRAEQNLLAAAFEETESFREEAKESVDTRMKQIGLTPLDVDPVVLIQIQEVGKILFVLRTPSHARQRANLEQKILRNFLQRQAQPTAPVAVEAA